MGKTSKRKPLKDTTNISEKQKKRNDTSKNDDDDRKTKRSDWLKRQNDNPNKST